MIYIAQLIFQQSLFIYSIAVTIMLGILINNVGYTLKAIEYNVARRQVKLEIL